MLVLPWVLDYHYKEGKGSKDQTKSRGPYKGSPRLKKKLRLEKLLLHALNNQCKD